MEYKIEIVNGEKKAKVGIYKPCNAEEIPAVIKHVSKMISYYSSIVNELIDNEERIDDSLLNEAIKCVVKFTEELKALNEAKKELEADDPLLNSKEYENGYKICEFWEGSDNYSVKVIFHETVIKSDKKFDYVGGADELFSKLSKLTGDELALVVSCKY